MFLPRTVTLLAAVLLGLFIPSSSGWTFAFDQTCYEKADLGRIRASMTEAYKSAALARYYLTLTSGVPPGMAQPLKSIFKVEPTDPEYANVLERVVQVLGVILEFDQMTESNIAANLLIHCDNGANWEPMSERLKPLIGWDRIPADRAWMSMKSGLIFHGHQPCHSPVVNTAVYASIRNPWLATPDFRRSITLCQGPLDRSPRRIKDTLNQVSDRQSLHRFVAPDRSYPVLSYLLLREMIRAANDKIKSYPYTWRNILALDTKGATENAASYAMLASFALLYNLGQVLGHSESDIKIGKMVART
ncbi:hypothetical protein EJ05DRAFT_477971 [Pseudovirgaria hyperparasitica]|uniref:Uncharacterized protein n=1 Tax=Pseudovirgaria hyperparasitica TaxID=470096 RepID=A0A6A6W1A4_9PEZI|nr:uncharacterized protein EJ05DRAFT_477971 [Pseudovirgaria hyperparasitica]KAF2755909.1 hypothetical protein EJ05DRAFT_477971 [Pseudovirgaria hyperparasitica]